MPESLNDRYRRIQASDSSSNYIVTVCPSISNQVVSTNTTTNTTTNSNHMGLSQRQRFARTMNSRTFNIHPFCTQTQAEGNPFNYSSIRYYMWQYQQNSGEDISNTLYTRIKSNSWYLFTEGNEVNNNLIIYAAPPKKWDGVSDIDWTDNDSKMDEHVWKIVYIPAEEKYTIQNTQRPNIYICNYSGGNTTRSNPSQPRLDITWQQEHSMWKIFQYDNVVNDGSVFVFSTPQSTNHLGLGYGYIDMEGFNDDAQNTNIYFEFEMLFLQ